MPREEDLPDGLAKLARRHALELSPTRWDYDVGQLFDVVARVLNPGGTPKPSPDVPDLESGIVEAALHAIDTVGVEKLRQHYEEKMRRRQPPACLVALARRQVEARPPELNVTEEETHAAALGDLPGLAEIGLGAPRSPR